MLALLLFVAPIQSQDSRPYYVEWVDIVATDGGWRSLDELNDWIANENSTVHQVGFLYAITEDYVVLVDSYFEDTTIGYAIRIPRGCIVKMEKR